MAGYDEYLRSTGTIRLVGFLLASLAFVPAIAFGALGDSGRFAGGVAVGATVVGSLSLVALIGAAVRRRRIGRRGDRDGEESGDVWALIPTRQYNGPYAESGASTRGEQEEALRETKERADETERYRRKRSK
jgi:hypothetical protein